MHRNLIPIFKTFIKKASPKNETQAASKTKDFLPDLDNAIQRLNTIEHDLSTVPQIFCDSITFEPMNAPLQIGIGQNQVIDKSNLDNLLHDGKYINPHTRQEILTPFSFNVGIEKKLQTLLTRIIELANTTQEADFNAEKENIANEIAALSTRVSGHQEQVLAKATECLYNLHFNLFESFHLFKQLKTVELRQLKERLERFEAQQLLNKQYERYISDLEKIDALKKQIQIDKNLNNPDYSPLIQELKKALRSFIINTSAITDIYEIESAIGKEKELLKQLMHPHYVRIISLERELKNLTAQKEIPDDLIGTNLTMTELLVIHNDHRIAEKERLTSLLLTQLEECIEFSLPSNEEEETERDELKQYFNKLILSTELHSPLEVSEKEFDHFEEGFIATSSKSKILSAFGLFSTDSTDKEKGKEKEKEKEKEVENVKGKEKAPSYSLGRNRDD